MNIVSTIKPSHIITMTKAETGLKGNEFSMRARNELSHEGVEFIDVVND